MRKRKRCLKCKGTKDLTLYYILPRRHFKGRGDKALLCRQCHDKVEKKISEVELYTYGNNHIALSITRYKEIFEQFLAEAL